MSSILPFRELSLNCFGTHNEMSDRFMCQSQINVHRGVYVMYTESPGVFSWLSWVKSKCQHNCVDSFSHFKSHFCFVFVQLWPVRELSYSLLLAEMDGNLVLGSDHLAISLNEFMVYRDLVPAKLVVLLYRILNIQYNFSSFDHKPV